MSEDLVLAWAVDIETSQPRYILKLDGAHKGKRCNCKCPSCNLPLIAINVGKSTWKRRPHFRHPEGAAREACVVIAARKAVEEMFGRQERIVLPRRYRTREVEGLSGTYHDAWVERPSETVRISDCTFEDEANAILTLDDGRRLHVRLLGRGELTRGSGDRNHLTASIEVHADDPAIANMAPEEILSKLQLVWDRGCWVRHWNDGEMDAEAEASAISKAIHALDWLETDELPGHLSPAERRETLLHREVKAILERERRIRVPELKTEAIWQRANGLTDTLTWSSPDVELQLSAVELEVHLGRSVPDVVATWIGKDGPQSMLIEVTVTNQITEERIERLASFGWPALEIDISRMGGCVTREEFTRLVVDEVAAKRWLYHPVFEEERSRLILVMQQEEAREIEIERQRQAILAVPAAEWGRRYLDAFRRRWREQVPFGDGHPDTEAWCQAQSDVSESMQGMEEHGYPASLLDEHPLRSVIARILSLHDGSGIEYRTDAWGVINAILCDRSRSRQWHTLYLIALKTYPQPLAKDHQDKVAAWRNDVVASVQNEETTYVRETTYDRLIGLLFPEMRLALSAPFGTPLYIPERERDFDDPRPTGELSRNRASLPAGSSGSVKIDDALLLQASARGIGQGKSPLSFARDYVRQVDGLTVDEAIARLVAIGVAKNKWEWS